MFSPLEQVLLEKIQIREHQLERNPNPYDIDVLVLKPDGNVVGGLECESHAKHWTGEEFPFQTVHFLHRKHKYIDQSNFYIMLNRGATTACMLPFRKLKQFKVKRIDTSVWKGDIFYDVPVRECIWGWRKINKELNKHFN
jgi:hypothetical protein